MPTAASLTSHPSVDTKANVSQPAVQQIDHNAAAIAEIFPYCTLHAARPTPALAISTTQLAPAAAAEHQAAASTHVAAAAAANTSPAYCQLPHGLSVVGD